MAKGRSIWGVDWELGCYSNAMVVDGRNESVEADAAFASHTLLLRMHAHHIQTVWS
jgi:hypothetical protein